VEVARTTDEEVFTNATRNLGHPLFLGQTLAGQDFYVEGQDLEKVNVVTGVKGSGKSHLSKVLLLPHLAWSSTSTGNIFTCLSLRLIRKVARFSSGESSISRPGEISGSESGSSGWLP
jgi:hypothetical protein